MYNTYIMSNLFESNQYRLPLRDNRKALWFQDFATPSVDTLIWGEMPNVGVVTAAGKAALKHYNVRIDELVVDQTPIAQGCNSEVRTVSIPEWQNYPLAVEKRSVAKDDILQLPAWVKLMMFDQIAHTFTKNGYRLVSNYGASDTSLLQAYVDGMTVGALLSENFGETEIIGIGGSLSKCIRPLDSAIADTFDDLVRKLSFVEQSKGDVSPGVPREYGLGNLRLCVQPTILPLNDFSAQGRLSNWMVTSADAAQFLQTYASTGTGEAITLLSQNMIAVDPFAISGRYV